MNVEELDPPGQWFGVDLKIDPNSRRARRSTFDSTFGAGGGLGQSGSPAPLRAPAVPWPLREVFYSGCGRFLEGRSFPGLFWDPPFGFHPPPLGSNPPPLSWVPPSLFGFQVNNLQGEQLRANVFFPQVLGGVSQRKMNPVPKVWSKRRVLKLAALV